MSKSVKFTLSDECYNQLTKRAEIAKLSVQDYVRVVLFPEYETSISPEIAVEKALEKYGRGDVFSLPEIFGDAWNVANGYAGVLGKNFCSLVNERYRTQIRFTGNYNSKNHALYERL